MALLMTALALPRRGDPSIPQGINEVFFIFFKDHLHDHSFPMPFVFFLSETFAIMSSCFPVNKALIKDLPFKAIFSDF